MRNELRYAGSASICEILWCQHVEPVVLAGRVLDAISPTYARRKPGAAPVLMFPVGHPGLQLEPGGSFTWPMWIYAQQAGTMQFQCVWFCEPQVRAAVCCCVVVYFMGALTTGALTKLYFVCCII